MTEPSRIDRRIATITTAVLLALGSGVFLAGAISAADTLLAADPDDRALSRQGAVLAVHVVRAPPDDQASDRTGDRKTPHERDHPAMHKGGPPVAAQVTIGRGDLERTFTTDGRGYVHLDLRQGAYDLTVATRVGTDSASVDVRELTHVQVEVSGDGTMTFTVEHHKPHHPPFRPMMQDDAPGRGAAHATPDARP